MPSGSPTFAVVEDEFAWVQAALEASGKGLSCPTSLVPRLAHLMKSIEGMTPETFWLDVDG